MSTYLIGIGGTGAKCLEAALHLAAVGGLGESSDEKFEFLFVDADRANGSLSRAMKTLGFYEQCHKINLGKCDMFGANCSAIGAGYWSPLDGLTHMTLENALALTANRHQYPPISGLIDILFTQEEQVVDLKDGFRGHPSIGAAVFAHALKRDGDSLLATLGNKILQEINAGIESKVIFFGSVFGGTGASGVPTLARLLRDRVDQARNAKARARFATVLMLPYFEFDPVTEPGLAADSKNFVAASKAALKYYHQQKALQVFDSIYLVGDTTPKKVGRTSVGGQTQENPAHFAELYAALGARDFITRNCADGCKITARAGLEKLEWEDFPYSGKATELQSQFERLTRFALAYEYAFYPALKEIEVSGGRIKAPWFVDLVEKHGINLPQARENQLTPLSEYCLQFLQWFASAQASVGRQSSQLLDYRGFAEETNEEVRLKHLTTWRIPSFGGVFRHRRSPSSPKALWNDLCDSPKGPAGANGIGVFVSALYQASLR
jgi:hypothetical protein